MWLRVFLTLLFINLAGLYGLWVLFGGGDAYRDLTSPPIVKEEQIEIVLGYPEPIGNVAVSDTGRIFFTVHPEAYTQNSKLIEWVNGEAQPFPGDSFAQVNFDSPLGIVIDRQDRLWVIDHGSHGLDRPSLRAFDIDSRRLEFEHFFESHEAGLGSFLQDIQVDSSGRYVFVADLSLILHDPSILVVDTEEKSVRRVLSGHPSVKGQSWQIQPNDEPLEMFGGLISIKPGVDGIALDNRDEYLYYGAMANDTLYRIKMDFLIDPAPNDVLLAEQVETVSEKPLSDGLSIDNADNVYITDIEHGAVMRLSPDGKLDTLVKSKNIRWADGLSFGADGYLYISDSALQQVTLSSRQTILDNGPYHIYRVQTGFEGTPGH